MERAGFRAPELLPVQLRLEVLSDRRAAAQRAATELMPDLPNEVSKHLRIRIEIGARTRSMFGLRRGLAGLVRTLCLVLDGSVPDHDDWYHAALRQLQGAGCGRRPILTPEVGGALLKIDVDPSCPDLDLPDTEALDMLKDQLATAIDLLRTLEALARSLDAELECGALFAGRLPDADFTKHHCTRQARATLQHAALGRAWASIKQLCDERGRRIVVFGSFFEGRVHGRSDLDLFLPETGLPEEIRVGLCRDIEALAHDEGIPVDIHFADTNADTFPDQIKVIVDGKIQPLRSLAGG
jgi:predicted nucleotidyltransferase